MTYSDKIHYGERLLMCAIIESAVEAFVSMADDPGSREHEAFKAVEEFLFGSGPMERVMLRDHDSGEPFTDGRERYVDCSLKKICDSLTINGQPLNVNYIRQGAIRRLEKKRNEEDSQKLGYRWTPRRG